MVDFFENIRFGDELFLVMSTLMTILITLLASTITYKSKNKMDVFMMKNEGEEIEKAVQKIQLIYKNVEKENNAESKNILSMMIDNVSELREYYVISKQQARKSFSAALFICFFGIFIYLFGIIAYLAFEKNISIISVIGGTVVEGIAGLFFWLYREATKQLSIYHQRLASTEKYLTVIQLIKDIPEDNQIYAYNQLMQSILSDNREIIVHEN